MNKKIEEYKLRENRVAFYNLFRDFIVSGQKIAEKWETISREYNLEVKNYPKYLPSFNEFITELEDITFSISKLK